MQSFDMPDKRCSEIRSTLRNTQWDLVGASDRRQPRGSLPPATCRDFTAAALTFDVVVHFTVIAACGPYVDMDRDRQPGSEN